MAAEAADPRRAGDLPQLAENLLCRLQENFQALTEKLTFLLEEMGERINDLEKRVADLMTEAGIEENTDEDLRLRRGAQWAPGIQPRATHHNCKPD
ncbi:heat shock factor-binding protein 1-like protein 1 isoform X2 [Manacus candei]|uniref:heat shock factor-binding protein 1-like protein 1 isoform X2 n=1 Tax=Manacus candei TaxID=415023 RepID=UPI0022262DF2|nr:heat shock factor-binding protein 1-like protein 1 isoform X2 [Manacus candei]